jgi:hypothetical protein
MIINNPDYLIIIYQQADPTVQGSSGAVVTAPLPETMAYDVASEYQAPFAQGMGGNGGFSQAASAAGIRLTTQAMTAQLWQGSTENEISLDLEFQTDTDPDLDVRQPVLTLMKFAAASVDTATGLLKSPGPRISLEGIAAIGKQAATQAEVALKQGANMAADVTGITKARFDTSKTLLGPATNLNSQQNPNGTQPVENGLGGSEFWKKNIINQISVQVGRYAFWDSVVILNVQETWSHEIDNETGLPLHAKVTIRFKPLFFVTQQDLDKIFGIRGR